VIGLIVIRDDELQAKIKINLSTPVYLEIIFTFISLPEKLDFNLS